MKFYVYELLDGNVVFYVGKGTGYRMRSHENESNLKADGNTHKVRKIRKMQKLGKPITKRKVFETDCEKEAFAKEIELIAFYGIANLCNHTCGGDGVSGYRHTPETIAKVKEARKGYVTSEATRAKMSVSAKGRLHTPEACEKMRLHALSRKQPEVTPEWKESMRIAGAKRKGRKLPHLSLALKKAYECPELRKKLSEAQKLRYKNPLQRIARSQLTTQQWAKKKALKQQPNQ